MDLGVPSYRQQPLAPSNSAKAKSVVVKKVNKGRVFTAKRSKLQKVKLFFLDRGGKGGVLTNITREVILPLGKTLVVKVVKDSIETMVYGKPQSSANPWGFNSLSSWGGWGAIGTPQATNYQNGTPGLPQQTFASTVMPSYQDLIFETRNDAFNVQIALCDLIKQMGYATVHDLYTLAGVASDHSAMRYGWRQLDGRIGIMRINNGWTLRMPKPIAL